jgi:hypothetical protein
LGFFIELIQTITESFFRNLTNSIQNNYFFASLGLMKATSIWIFFTVALMAALLTNCRKETFITDSSAMLAFSSDTVLFDTVFTTVGSVTKTLKVYNNNDDRIKISSIQLAQGESSPYRINVDGIAGDSHQDVEIAANDSLFIFVEVTVDPNNANTPFVVEDDLLFNTNGNEQTVNLVAWGQDAYFHGSSSTLTVLPDGETWNADKPHVIYGVVAVDSLNTLTINAGTQVHVHANSGLYVYKGSLIVNGEFGNEVVFQGDRLEPLYSDEPGQWGFSIGGQTIGGIYLFQNTASSIDYAIIENGIIGLHVDTVGSATENALTLTNTKIRNMSAIGIFAKRSRISGYNNLITNCGQACGAFTLGGEYNMDYCTFANYWPFHSRQDPAFVMSNFFTDANNNLQVQQFVNTNFRNCIMYGTNANQNDFNEFVVALQDPELQAFNFEYCLVDTDQNLSNENGYENMTNGIAPTFVSPGSGDFHLSSAPSAMQGTPVSPPNVDLDNQSRTGLTDKGCYEFVN